MTETPITPIHQWTNGGEEVLVVRFVDRDGRSSSKRRKDGVSIAAEPFQHPLTVGESVTAPDWIDDFACGGGIHGWPWAMSLGEGKDCDWTAKWLVYGVQVADIRGGSGDFVGKVKFRTGVLRHVGTWDSATNFVLAGQMAWVHQAASGAASATGWSGAASATGESGAASATGKSGAASATGESGAASATGESGAASATGWSGAASATGESSLAGVTGVNGRARAGKYGCIALAWWNANENRQEMRCALTGPGVGLLKPDTWYELNADGEFVEATK